MGHFIHHIYSKVNFYKKRFLDMFIFESVLHHESTAKECSRATIFSKSSPFVPEFDTSTQDIPIQKDTYIRKDRIQQGKIKEISLKNL